MLDLIRGVLSSYVLLLLLLVLLFLLPPLSLLAVYVFFGKMEGGVDPIAQYIFHVPRPVVVDVQFVPYSNTYLTFYTLAIETV